MALTPEELERRKSELHPEDPILKLEEKCIAEQVAFEWAPSLVHEDSLRFRISIPNGREKRLIAVPARRALDFLTLKLDDIAFIGEYDAILFRSTGVIEATITGRSFLDPRITTLPGIRRINSSAGVAEDPEDGESSDPSADQSEKVGPDDAWVLEFKPSTSHPNLKIELGSSSAEFTALSEHSRRRGMARDRRPLPTIRISGLGQVGHNEALKALESISSAVFFETDIRYGTLLRIAPSPSIAVRSNIRRSPKEFPPETPKNPVNQYPEKPLSLYRYGRESAGLPLLEYLAYYQVLEYFFPSFSHRNTLEKLRNELLDPRFRADDNDSLVRIISLTSGAGKGFGSEREQLRSTIGGCTTVDHIRSLIEEDPALSEHFSGKQKVKDVAIINTKDRQNDLLTATANRIYDIRCRIVHTKEEGGKAADLLLPFSKEADSLSPDIELIRFIAQKVLIAGASRLQI